MVLGVARRDLGLPGRGLTSPDGLSVELISGENLDGKAELLPSRATRRSQHRHRWSGYRRGEEEEVEK